MIETGVDLEQVIREHGRALRARGLADSTIYQRGRAVTRLADAGVDPLAATTNDLEAWAVGLTTGMEARATEISHVRGWFRWLHETGRIADNPALAVHRPKLPQPLPRPMSDDDLELARGHAEVEVATWLTLAGYAGLRCAEIAQLRRDDVHHRDGRDVVYVRGKGGRDRIVPVAELVMAQLRAWGLTDRRPWVFPRRDGNPGPRPPWIVSHVGNEHLRSVGVDATMHQARHRFATRLYETTHDIVLVQRMLGHASILTTRRYVSWSDTDAAAAVEAIGPPSLRRRWLEDDDRNTP